MNSFDIQWDEWDEKSQALIERLNGQIQGYLVSQHATTGKWQLIESLPESDPHGIALCGLDGNTVKIAVYGGIVTRLPESPIWFPTSPFATYINDDLDMGDES